MKTNSLVKYVFHSKLLREMTNIMVVEKAVKLLNVTESVKIMMWLSGMRQDPP